MELTPLQVGTERLHKLANAIMCQDEEDLQKTLDWPGPEKGSRQQLLNNLQVKTFQPGLNSCSMNCHLIWIDTNDICILIIPDDAHKMHAYGASQYGQAHTFAATDVEHMKILLALLIANQMHFTWSLS